MAQNVVFCELKAPPTMYHDSKPIYYGENGNYVFITGTEIFKYDLDQQIMAEIYTSDVYSNDHESCIDHENGIIYLVGGDDKDFFHSFNIKTKEWNHSLCHYHDVDYCPNIIFIPSPINQLHLKFNGKHFKFDAKNKSLITLNHNLETTRCYLEEEDIFVDVPIKYIYNSLNKQLMIFQPESENILFCQVTDKNQQTIHWKNYSLKMPKIFANHYDFDVVMAWNQIIFMFDYKDKFIWCLDIIHNDKWFKSMHDLSFSNNLWDTIKDKQNNVHLISFKEFQRLGHFKASLYDLLPSEIIKLNKRKYNPLVIGYIKECEKDKQCPFIAVDLKQLIFEFYPIFI